jgi:hypothetical protein
MGYGVWVRVRVKGYGLRVYVLKEYGLRGMAVCKAAVKL